MKRERDYKRKNWGSLARVLFAVFAVMALLAGPGLAQNALADIKSDLEAKIDNPSNPMSLEEASQAVMEARLAAGENYDDVLAALEDAVTLIAEERGWDVAEAKAFVASGAEKGKEAAIRKGEAPPPPPSTTTTETTSTTSSTTSTTTTTMESTVSPAS